jgi:hypothetical protein
LSPLSIFDLMWGVRDIFHYLAAPPSTAPTQRNRRGVASTPRQRRRSGTSPRPVSAAPTVVVPASQTLLRRRHPRAVGAPAGSRLTAPLGVLVRSAIVRSARPARRCSALALAAGGGLGQRHGDRSQPCCQAGSASLSPQCASSTPTPPGPEPGRVSERSR